MAMADVTLRTYVFLDSLQPQLASYIGTTSRGFLPTPGVASMLIEIAPGMQVNRLLDVALKASQSRPSILVVERAFGLMEIHHEDKGQVQLGGNAVLDYLGLPEVGRIRPKIVSNEIIRSIEPYQAQLINRIRYGDMLLPGQSLFILECEPAGYIAYAANEAEKAANIHLVEVRLFGAFGRLYLGGSEAEIDAAADAALRALHGLEGVEEKVRVAAGGAR